MQAAAALMYKAQGGKRRRPWKPTSPPQTASKMVHNPPSRRDGMKKVLSVIFALALAVTLSFAQTTQTTSNDTKASTHASKAKSKAKTAGSATKDAAKAAGSTVKEGAEATADKTKSVAGKAKEK